MRMVIDPVRLKHSRGVDHQQTKLRRGNDKSEHEEPVALLNEALAVGISDTVN